MILETNRVLLRPWVEEDASDLYEYAKEPLVGPSAGWPVHTSVENSKEIIKSVLSKPNTFAVVFKKTNKVIGSVGLMIGAESNLSINDNEAEIGYWLGVPYWGQGLIPEAVEELIRYGFEELQLRKLWCGYFDGNHKSKRVQEKCGFTYHHTNKDVKFEFIDAIVTEHVTCLIKQDWLKRIDE